MDNQHAHFWDGRIRGIIILALVMGIVALGAYSYATFKETRYFHGGPATITVNGEGEIFARPDIATFSFSVITEGEDAGTAQERSAEGINEILAFLGEQGIEERDIKTQYYNLNPRYDYLQSICDTRGFCPPGERVLRGYEVNQTVEVKVRTVENAGTLIAGVGERGATNVSGLQFTIDDDQALLAQAREQAITDAREKAEKLAQDLGVQLGRVVGFYENEGGYPYYSKSEAAYGGADMAQMAPEMPTGENTFMSQVNITYEIK